MGARRPVGRVEEVTSKVVLAYLRIALPAAAAAVCLTIAAAHAQFGAPIELRRMAPTVEDSDPGVAPDPRAALPDIYRRTPVRYRSDEAPGTIIIDTSERFLHLIQGNGIALRYGIGVGRDGFQWNGLLRVTRKSEWPDWTPPPEMIKRQPYLPRFMAGGPGNPMGARALSRPDHLSHPRHQRAAYHRACGLVRLFPAGQRRDRGPLRPRRGRRESDRAAVGWVRREAP
jgi:lipoprotein-anchoring transpeptidase ErfK/SrfK